MRGAALLALALLAAGCTAAPHADEAPLEPTAEPVDAHANMTAAEHAANATDAAADAARTFAPQEHDLHVGPYADVAAANWSTGNMKDASWTVDIPAGARTISVKANITTQGPGVQLGDLVLMIHNGTADQPGGMLAGSDGEPKVGPTPIPPGARTLCVMFHVEGDPAAAQGPMDAHLVATFA